MSADHTPSHHLATRKKEISTKTPPPPPPAPPPPSKKKKASGGRPSKWCGNCFLQEHLSFLGLLTSLFILLLCSFPGKSNFFFSHLVSFLFLNTVSVHSIYHDSIHFLFNLSSSTSSVQFDVHSIQMFWTACLHWQCFISKCAVQCNHHSASLHIKVVPVNMKTVHVISGKPFHWNIRYELFSEIYCRF